MSAEVTNAIQPTPTDRLLTVSFGAGDNLAAIKRVQKLSWPKLAALLTEDPPETTDKASAGWYAAAEFNPVYRHGGNLVGRHALTFDYDTVSKDDVNKTIREAFKNQAYALYTTWSHTRDTPRVRVVLPLSRPCNADEFCAVSRHVAALAGIELAARESHVPAQCMFLPAKKPGGFFKGVVHAGEWVDVDSVLASYEDCTNRASWPHRSVGDSTHHGATTQLPNEKSGIVGDFCRAFDIPAAISRFDLPYEPSQTPGRWTYTEGSRAEGAVEYDNGQKLHVHHDSSPARGQVNSFDLVRLHRFSERDSGLGDDVAMTDRPSFKAMVALALEQPELRTVRLHEELEDLGEPTGTELETRTQSTAVATQIEPLRPVEVPDDDPLRFIPLAEFANRPFPGWLIHSILPRADLGMIYGPPGSGKSFLAFDIGCALSRGVADWCGHRAKRVNVGWVAAEATGSIGLRARAYAKHHGIPVESITLPVIAHAPDMGKRADLERIAAGVKAAGIKLLFIDTLAAVSGGRDENTTEMQQVMNGCFAIRRATGAMVILIHHSGKDLTRGARGSTAIRGAVDFELEVDRADDTRNVRITKMRDGADGDGFAFKLQPLVIGTDDDGNSVTSCVLIPSEMADKKGAAPKVRLGQNESACIAAVHRLFSGTGDFDAQLGVDLDEFVAEAVKNLPHNGDKRDQRRAAVSRALQTCEAKGLLTLQAGRVFRRH